MSRFVIDASGFQKAVSELRQQARKNTETYGRTLARTYEVEAKSGAPWVDRRGNARRHLYGISAASGTRVRVEMGGSAPNYKPRTALSAADYMEYLEFDHGGRHAIVYPTADAIMYDVKNNFGEAALKGRMRTNIRRNRRELNARRKDVLMKTAAAAGWWQQIAYENWLGERGVFNR